MLKQNNEYPEGYVVLSLKERHVIPELFLNYDKAVRQMNACNNLHEDIKNLSYEIVTYAKKEM